LTLFPSARKPNDGVPERYRLAPKSLILARPLGPRALGRLPL